MKNSSCWFLFLMGCVILWPMVGCGHTSYTVAQGGMRLEGRSYDEQGMALAASKAYTNAYNSETCREAMELGSTLMTTDCTTTPYRGYGGMGVNGMNGGGIGGINGFYYGGISGYQTSPQPSGGVMQGSSSQTGVTRDELEAVKAQATRAEKKGDAAIGATERVVKRLSVATAPVTPTTSSAHVVAPVQTPVETPMTTAPSAPSSNLPPP